MSKEQRLDLIGYVVGAIIALSSIGSACVLIWEGLK